MMLALPCFAVCRFGSVDLWVDRLSSLSCVSLQLLQSLYGHLAVLWLVNLSDTVFPMTCLLCSLIFMNLKEVHKFSPSNL